MGDFWEGYQFTVLGNKTFFSGTRESEGGTYGRELYACEGDDECGLVLDIEPGMFGAPVDDMVAVGDRVWFVATNGEFGSELWSCTENGTCQVHDLISGSGSSSP